MKINWKKLLSILWSALKPALIAALSGGIVASASGCCSEHTPSAKSQNQCTVGVGFPVVIMYRSSGQIADNSGSDKNTSLQENPIKPAFTTNE